MKVRDVLRQVLGPRVQQVAIDGLAERSDQQAWSTSPRSTIASISCKSYA